MTEEVSFIVWFMVPLPPVALRANSRAHWTAKKKAADAYSHEVESAVWDETRSQYPRSLRWNYVYPWAKATVHYEWRYAGVQPDLGNIPGNVKYLQDILCMAPKLSPEQAEKYKRWHLGLVENDREITPTYEISKVATKAEEAVVVTLRREGG